MACKKWANGKDEMLHVTVWTGLPGGKQIEIYTKRGGSAVFHEQEADKFMAWLNEAYYPEYQKE